MLCGIGPALVADFAFAWLLGRRAPGVVSFLLLVSVPTALMATLLLYFGRGGDAFEGEGVHDPDTSTLSGAGGAPAGAIAPWPVAARRVDAFDRQTALEIAPRSSSAAVTAAPGIWPAGPIVAVLLAISGQAELLRTRQPLPAVALFLAAAVIGGVSARRWFWSRELGIGRLAAPNGQAWRPMAAAALLTNGGALLLFARNTGLNLAWLLFLLSIAAAVACAWLMDGKPRLPLPQRGDLPHLLALAAVLAAGAAVRLIWLDHIPFGVWFDEAYSALQVERIMSDATFRPVFLGAQAQAPALFWYMAVPFFKAFGAVPLAMRLVNAVGGSLGPLAIYAAGRELYGRRVGLIAAAILACFTWHINFSRFVPNPAVWSVSLDALAVAFLILGLRRRSWLALALCGVALGVGQHMYYTSRVMLGVVAFVLAAALLAGQRDRLAAGVQALLAIAVAGLICASPLILYARQHPAEFGARSGTVSVLNEVRQKHTYQPVLDNLRAHLLMFNLQGDPNARHNIPGNPELNLILGGLAVLGLGMALSRARQPEYLLLPVWGGAMLLGGVLTLSFEAPQSMRSIGETNVVALLAALPVAFGWQALDEVCSRVSAHRSLAAGLAALPVLGIVGASGFLDVNRYFNVEMHDSRSFDEYSTVETFVARAANELSHGTAIYMDSTLAGTPTIRFLSPWLTDQKVFSDSTLPLRDAVDTALFLKQDEQVQLLRHLYPKAQVRDFTALYGGPVVLHEIRVSGAEIAAIQGVEATYSSSGVTPVRRKESAVDVVAASLPVAPPIRAALQGILAAPTFGTYGFRLEGPSGAQLSIDDRPVAGAQEAVDLKLAQGNHRLSVSSDLATSDSLRLLWRPPKADGWTTVPRTALFVDPVTDNGLLGRYYPNGTWSGSASIERIDPAVAFSFHILPLPYPYSIEWTGQLAAPIAGLYHFGTTSIDSSQVWIDGQQIVDNQVPNDYHDGQVTLSAGLHEIRVRFEAHTGHNHVELFWQPPGQERQIIPSSFFYPSRSAGETQPPLDSAASPPPAVAASPLPVSSATVLNPLWRRDLPDALGGDSQPGGIAMDGSGNLYIADPGRHAIEKVDADGHPRWAFADNVVDPSAVALEPSGNVLGLDAANGYVYRLSPDGTLINRFGGPDLALYRPRGMAVGRSGDVYIADTGGGRVVHVDGAGKLAAVIGGSGASRQPTGVAVLPSGEVVVVDGDLGKLLLFDPAGGLEREWGFSQASTVNGPQLAVAADGSAWATDPSSGLLVRLDPSGHSPTVFRTSPDLASPSGIAVGNGRLVVVESAAKRLDGFSLPDS